MPSSADPRMNLALVLEKAGRIDEAIQSYQAALEVQAEHLPTIQALSRAQVRYQKQDEETRDHLHIIALRGDETWRAWARSELLRSDAAIPPR
jgi:tetratricopeptide (TPR) repeat protein